MSENILAQFDQLDHCDLIPGKCRKGNHKEGLLRVLVIYLILSFISTNQQNLKGKSTETITQIQSICNSASESFMTFIYKSSAKVL